MQPSSNPGNARNGKVFAGILLLAVGSIWFMKNLGFTIPALMLSKGIFLILFGLFIGFRSRFRSPLAAILIIIGSLLFAEKAFQIIILWKFIWPTLIIIFGLFMIFGKGRHRNWGPRSGPGFGPYHGPEKFTQPDSPENPDPANPTGPAAEHRYYQGTDEEYLDTISVLGGTKKLILSKNFKGGELVTFLGGTELNLSQADIQGVAVLDVTQIMGGTKIIVPANWEVKSEMIAILGGMDDKRTVYPGQTAANKVLIIKGTSVLGGIDIRSF